MARSGLFAVLAVVAALALPAVSFAGSAGDNQYSDPFGGSKPQTSQPDTNTTPAAATPAPATSTPSQSASPTATTAAPGGELPHTGLDLRVVAGIGILFVASGVLLWRRTARR